MSGSWCVWLGCFSRDIECGSYDGGGTIDWYPIATTELWWNQHAVHRCGPWISFSAVLLHIAQAINRREG